MIRTEILDDVSLAVGETSDPSRRRAVALARSSGRPKTADRRRGGPDPTAVVVGATGGIGRSISRRLALDHGLCLVGRSEAALHELCSEFEDAVQWVVDLRSHDDLSPPSMLTDVNVLVLTAGVWVSGRIEHTTARVWDEVFAVNVFGQIALTRALLPALRANGGGQVIIVNSTGIGGSPQDRAAYIASKTAMRVFAKALNEEERLNGIKVTTLYPGRVDTQMQRDVQAAHGGGYREDHLLSVDAVAGAVSDILNSDPHTHFSDLVIRPWD